jgi:formate dehydrogenase subunit gamma
VRDSIPNGKDVSWFTSGGGLIGSGHPPAGRFNGGQKLVFWITVIGGTLLAISGYFLMFASALTDVGGQQLSHWVHGVIGVLMIAAMIGHAYIGSIGMEGAFDAMGSGQVDVNWAREHHSLWVEDEMRRAREIVAGRTATKAAGAD